jgi:lipopolysaccharide export system ATP-binding protein
MSVLSANDLSKSYRDRHAVARVSIAIRRGEIVGLMGPSGAGKTTIFALIAGIESPDFGRIFLDDSDITQLPMFERARRGISYLTQEPSIFRGLTVEQNILLALETLTLDAARRRSLLEAVLHNSGLKQLRKVSAGKLSGGERRRAEIVRALASNPRFILLDEPFAGIDPIASKGLRILVRDITKRGIGVLITDHNVRETLNLVDRAYMIDGGRVLMHGTPDSIVADPRVRETYLGANFQL